MRGGLGAGERVGTDDCHTNLDCDSVADQTVLAEVLPQLDRLRGVAPIYWRQCGQFVWPGEFHSGGDGGGNCNVF